MHFDTFSRKLVCMTLGSVLFLSGCETLTKIQTSDSTPPQTATTLSSTITNANTADTRTFFEKLSMVEDLADGRLAHTVPDSTCKNLIQPANWQDNLISLTAFATRQGLNAALTEEKLTVKRFKNAARHLNWIPPQIETLVGEYSFKEMEALALPREGKRNTALYQKAEDALSQIIAKIDQPLPYQFTVHILQRNTGQAQALPGGIILLDKNVLTEEEELNLMFKLAHEVAHVLQRHTTTMYQARILDGLDTLESGLVMLRSLRGVDKNPREKQTLGNAVELFYGTKKLFSDFSADQETNADACAFHLVAALKGKQNLGSKELQTLLKSFGDPIDDNALIKVSEETKFFSFLIDGQFERHPSTASRRTHLTKLWRTGIEPAKLKKFDDEQNKQEQVFAKQQEKLKKATETAQASLAAKQLAAKQVVAKQFAANGKQVPVDGLVAVNNKTSAPTTSESRLNDQERTIGRRLDILQKEKSDAKFEDTNKGIKLSGKSFGDAEGEILLNVIDEDQAAMTYLVGKADRSAILKKVSAGSPDVALILGTVTRGLDGSYVFVSSSGREIAGEHFFLMDSGLLMFRRNVAFRYIGGEGIGRVSLPDNWIPTPLQRGSVSKTGWVLLQRPVQPTQGSKASALLDIAKTWGVAQAKDYALFNIATDKLMELNISASGRFTTAYDRCEEKNKFISKCRDSYSYESIWDAKGGKNSHHYYWNATWFKLGDRTLLISLESGNGKINAYDLATGKKVVLLERVLGFPGFEITHDGTKKISVTSNMLLFSEKVDDVLAKLDDVPSPAPVALPIETPVPAAEKRPEQTTEVSQENESKQ